MLRREECKPEDDPSTILDHRSDLLIRESKSVISLPIGGCVTVVHSPPVQSPADSLLWTPLTALKIPPQCLDTHCNLIEADSFYSQEAISRIVDRAVECGEHNPLVQYW